LVKIETCWPSRPLSGPADFSKRIARLGRLELHHPFRNALGRGSLEERIKSSTDQLRRVGLDHEAALGIYAAATYVTDEGMSDAWRVAAKRLSDAVRCEVPDLPGRCAFFQVDGESHINEFAVANAISRRKDPEQFPPLHSVGRLEEFRLLCLDGAPFTPQERGVASRFLERDIWVLLWDLNLSGRTVATELRRLRKYAGCLRTRPTKVLLCCALTGAGASHAGAGAATRGGVFAGMELPRATTLSPESDGPLGPDWGRRAMELCQSFFVRFVEGSADPGLRRYVERGGTAFGYRGGALTLVTQRNAPNNSLPILWVDLPGAYSGPFPRIMSQVTHTSLAPRSFDAMSREESSGCAASLHLHLALEGVAAARRRRKECGAPTRRTRERYIERIVTGMKGDPAEREESVRLVQRLGLLCAGDAGLWGMLVEQIDGLLKDEFRDLKLIRHMVDASVDPVDNASRKVLKGRPRTRLLFRLSQLRIANHEGRVVDAARRVLQVQQLERLVAGEDPSLTLESALNRAVHHLNAYNFKGAERVLTVWARDPRLAGLGSRDRGALLSSIGQALAFQGRERDAMRLFERALALFEQITEPDEREKEIRHTGCLLAIAAMDCGSRDAEALVEAVVGRMGRAAEVLSVGEEPRYLHHLLLRYLVLSGRHPRAIRRCLNVTASWSDGTLFPFPLIDFYRAVMLRQAGDEAGSRRWLERALELAYESEKTPTLHMIGLGIAAAAKIAGLARPALDVGLAARRLRRALPMASKRIDRAEAICAGAPARGLSEELRYILPFNYR